jgi:hypothetical protein
VAKLMGADADAGPALAAPAQKDAAAASAE